MLASVQYGTHMWTILLIESMEEYRVGPEGVMVGGGYDAALDHPSVLSLGRALETISPSAPGKRTLVRRASLALESSPAP
jgi:hypothetical protein